MCNFSTIYESATMFVVISTLTSSLSTCIEKYTTSSSVVVVGVSALTEMLPLEPVVTFVTVNGSACPVSSLGFFIPTHPKSEPTERFLNVSLSAAVISDSVTSKFCTPFVLVKGRLGLVATTLPLYGVMRFPQSCTCGLSQHRFRWWCSSVR